MPQTNTQRPLDHDPVSLSWARMSRKISQRALAQALKMSQGSLSQMEAGVRNCPIDLQRKIADELKCPPEILAAKQDRAKPLRRTA